LTEVVTKAPNKIRVIIASNVPITGAGLEALLSAQPSLEVVGESEFGNAFEEVHRWRPHVVVVHCAAHHHADALKLAQALRKEDPPPAVVVLTVSAEDAYVRSFLMAGASGYVLANSHPCDLVAAITQAARGGTFLDPSLSDSIVRMLVHRPLAAGDNGGVESLLSERERQVLRLIALGHTHQEIANTLSVSAKTVDTYRTRIAEKTNLRTRAEIVRYAMALGLMDVGND
jgi:two-component system response regulator NreC